MVQIKNENEKGPTKSTYEAWADITLKEWVREVKKEGIVDTGELLKSFHKKVSRVSGGDRHKIKFFFSYYGKFLHYGLGRGVDISQALAGNTKGRKPRKWYNSTLYTNLQALGHILQEKYEAEAYSEVETALGNEDININL